MLALLSPKKIIAALIGIAMAATIYFAVDFLNDKNVAEARVVELQRIVENKEEAVRILTAAALQKHSAIAAADAAREQLATLQSSYGEILLKADVQNDEDDAPIAPVLRGVLDSLGGM